MNQIVVTSDKPSSSFDLINLVLLVGVPDAASVFKDGADKGFVAGFFNRPGGSFAERQG